MVGCTCASTRRLQVLKVGGLLLYCRAPPPPRRAATCIQARLLRHRSRHTYRVIVVKPKRAWRPSVCPNPSHMPTARIASRRRPAPGSGPSSPRSSSSSAAAVALGNQGFVGVSRMKRASNKTLSTGTNFTIARAITRFKRPVRRRRAARGTAGGNKRSAGGSPGAADGAGSS